MQGMSAWINRQFIPQLARFPSAGRSAWNSRSATSLYHSLMLGNRCNFVVDEALPLPKSQNESFGTAIPTSIKELHFTPEPMEFCIIRQLTALFRRFVTMAIDQTRHPQLPFPELLCRAMQLSEEAGCIFGGLVLYPLVTPMGSRIVFLVSKK